MVFGFKKDKRPIDVFNNIKRPHLEEAYIKFPGRRLRTISKERGTYYVSPDDPLIDKLQKKYGFKYTDIHTHPSGNLMPSTADLTSFLRFDESKASVIVPLAINSKEAQGYFVMKKNRGHKLSLKDKEYLPESFKEYDKSILLFEPPVIASNLNELAKKYDFSFRFFPAKGFSLTKEFQGFKSSRKTLETKLSAIPISLLSLSVLLSLSDITGNTILNGSFGVSNAMGMSLFFLITGIIFVGFVVFFVGKDSFQSR